MAVAVFPRRLDVARNRWVAGMFSDKKWGISKVLRRCETLFWGSSLAAVPFGGRNLAPPGLKLVVDVLERSDCCWGNGSTTSPTSRRELRRHHTTSWRTSFTGEEVRKLSFRHNLQFACFPAGHPLAPSVLGLVAFARTCGGCVTCRPAYRITRWHTPVGKCIPNYPTILDPLAHVTPFISHPFRLLVTPVLDRAQALRVNRNRIKVHEA